MSAATIMEPSTALIADRGLAAIAELNDNWMQRMEEAGAKMAQAKKFKDRADELNK